MVLAAGGDIERAVDLLEHHNAREMMRERHGRHGQPQRSLLLDDFELAVAAEPLLVFLVGLRPELFSELADADQPDTKYTVSSSVSTTGASMQSRGATQTVQCSLPCRAFFVC